MSADNLLAMFRAADFTDYREGLRAYERYHMVMTSVADEYHQPLPRVVAAFAALSPNNEYSGNLRSLVTICHAIRHHIPPDKTVTSGYGHRKFRAFAYLTGKADFLAQVRGLKTHNFYHNILDPSDTRWVTIDGHMVAAWYGDQKMTMREAALKSAAHYREIADAVKRLAFREYLRPWEMQAIIWFTRKRVCNVRFQPQGDLFDWLAADLWQSFKDIRSIKPYEKALPGSTGRAFASQSNGSVLGTSTLPFGGLSRPERDPGPKR